MNAICEPIDPALLGPDRPCAEKLFIQILPDADDLLDVTISVQLDPKEKPERKRSRLIA